MSQKITKKTIVIFLVSIYFLNINSCVSCKCCKKPQLNNKKSTKLNLQKNKSTKKIIKTMIKNTPELIKDINSITIPKITNDNSKTDDEIGSIYENYPNLVDKNINTTEIALIFEKEDDFYFNGNNEYRKKAFDKTCEFIKKLIKKKNLSGTFNVKKIEFENTGKNDIKKAEIKSQSGITFHFFIKKDNNISRTETYYMLKGAEMLNLLPFNYYYDPDTSVVITEDVTEKGYILLDFGLNVTTKNKNILNRCVNINEFRFWCYILGIDDIDPLYKYDNVCFKNNNVYALDLRYSDKVKIYENSEKEYSELFKCMFRSINTNDITEEDKNTEHYKYWEQSIDNFTDFTDEEKADINKKLITLLIYFTKLLEKDKRNGYLESVLTKIYNFFKDYIKKYSAKNGKMKFGDREDFQLYLDYIRHRIGGNTYNNLNSIFMEYIQNKTNFKSILTKETVVKMFDVFCHSVNLNIYHNQDIISLL